jgi:putative addiction module CopG family antidote
VKWRKVDFPKALDAFIADSIASGRYPNASAVVRDGVSLLQARYAARQRMIAEIDCLRACQTLMKDA